MIISIGVSKHRTAYASGGNNCIQQSRRIVGNLRLANDFVIHSFCAPVAFADTDFSCHNHVRVCMNFPSQGAIHLSSASITCFDICCILVQTYVGLSSHVSVYSPFALAVESGTSFSSFVQVCISFPLYDANCLWYVSTSSASVSFSYRTPIKVQASFPSCDTIGLPCILVMCDDTMASCHTHTQTCFRLLSLDAISLAWVIACFNSDTPRVVHSGDAAAVDYEAAIQPSELEFISAYVHPCTRPYAHSRMHTHARTHVLSFPLLFPISARQSLLYST